MAPIANETVDGIMQILQVVIPTAATIRVGRVGKRSIIRLGCDELICQGFEPKIVNGDGSRDTREYFTHDSAFASSSRLDSSGWLSLCKFGDRTVRLYLLSCIHQPSGGSSKIERAVRDQNAHATNRTGWTTSSPAFRLLTRVPSGKSGSEGSGLKTYSYSGFGQLHSPDGKLTVTMGLFTRSGIRGFTAQSQ
jgi:hypothetical protein